MYPKFVQGVGEQLAYFYLWIGNTHPSPFCNIFENLVLGLHVGPNIIGHLAMRSSSSATYRVTQKKGSLAICALFEVPGWFTGSNISRKHFQTLFSWLNTVFWHGIVWQSSLWFLWALELWHSSMVYYSVLVITLGNTKCNYQNGIVNIPRIGKLPYGAKWGFIERKALLKERLYWKKGFIERKG